MLAYTVHKYDDDKAIYVLLENTTTTGQVEYHLDPDHNPEAVPLYVGNTTRPSVELLASGALAEVTRALFALTPEETIHEIVTACLEHLGVRPLAAARALADPDLPADTLALCEATGADPTMTRTQIAERLKPVAETWGTPLQELWDSALDLLTRCQP
jgi:hypothetical protein